MNVGRALSMMRPVREVTCHQCEETFTARDTRAKFCSQSCRQKAHYHKSRNPEGDIVAK
jgi:hypothetical protein